MSRGRSARGLRRANEHGEGRNGERVSVRVDRRHSAEASAVPRTRGGWCGRVEGRRLAIRRMPERETPEACARRVCDIAEQLGARGSEHGGRRRIAISVGCARARKELATTAGMSGFRGLRGRERGRGGDARADIVRQDARERAGYAGSVRACGGRLGGAPQEQREARQHTGGRHAKRANRKGARRPFSSQWCPEVAAHDSSYPVDQRKVPGSAAVFAARHSTDRCEPRDTLAATQRSRCFWRLE